MHLGHLEVLHLLGQKQERRCCRHLQRGDLIRWSTLTQDGGTRDKEQTVHETRLLLAEYGGDIKLHGNRSAESSYSAHGSAGLKFQVVNGHSGILNRYLHR